MLTSLAARALPCWSVRLAVVLTIATFTLPSLAVDEPPPAPDTPDPDEGGFVPAYASLAHPLATNHERPFARTRLGLDLLYGRAGALDGGLQLGVVNLVVGKEGVASGDMSGLQLSPIGFDYASGHASGMQIGLVGNAVGRGLEGAQITLGSNVAVGAVSGAQLAFGVNVATEAMRGLQVAGINVAGDVKGMQLGLINVAGKVDGATIGVINVADDVDGVPLGLVSVTRSGGVHPTFWGSSATVGNVGVRFATRHTYTMVAAHYANVSGGAVTPSNGGRARLLDDRGFVGGGFFLGGHVPIDQAFVDFDLGVSLLGAPESSERARDDGSLRSRHHDILVDPRLRVMGGYAFAPHVSLYAGVGLLVRTRIVEGGEAAVIQPMPELFAGLQL